MGKCKYESHEEGSECNTVDIHSFITKQVYHDRINVPIEKIKEVPEFNRMRSICKSVTFGLAYGGTAVGLANSTGIPLSEAKEVVNLYFKTFPAIKNYIEECQKYVDREGQIVDMVGRRRYFQYAGWKNLDKASNYYELWRDDPRQPVDKCILNPEWENDDTGTEPKWIKTGFKKARKEYRSYVSKNQRAGINFPIQGLAASMTKIAATALAEEFKEHPSWDAKIIQFIHDEVLVHCKKEPHIIRAVISAIEDCMINRINMPSHCLPNHPLKWSWPHFLPMSVEAEVGDSYGEIMDPEKYIAKIQSNKQEEVIESDPKDIDLTGEEEDDTDWALDDNDKRSSDYRNDESSDGNINESEESDSDEETGISEVVN